MSKKKKLLVTVVTVIYNLIEAGREEYFRQCLESVHNQTYENVEHIVIDGASIDGTIDLIEEYKKKSWITYASEKDEGIYDAMNKGIKMANGKYIAFLNSDDYYSDDEVVEISVKKLEEKRADFSYANCTQIYQNKKNIWSGIIESFLYTMPFSHQTMFANTDVIKKMEGFKTKYKVAADYDLIIKLILNDYQSVFVDKNIASCRMIGDSQVFVQECIDETSDIYKRNFKNFYDFSDYKQASDLRYKCKITKKFISAVNIYFIKCNLKNIDTQKTIEYLEIKKEKCFYMSNSLLSYLSIFKKKFFPKKWF